MIDVPRDELRLVLDAEHADEIEPLRPRPLASAVGVWRVRADGRSAILKLLALNAGPSERWLSDPDPAHPYWWLREPAAYESGALAPFGAPALLARVDRDDGTVALWLGDGGDPPETWAPPLSSLPQTVCHNDFHPANVVGDGSIVDWAYCGVGPIGMDAGVLVVDGIADGAFPPEQADGVAAAVDEGYTRGLGLDDDRVRAGFVAGARRLRWLPRGRSAARDATVDFIERLGSER